MAVREAWLSFSAATQLNKAWAGRPESHPLLETPQGGARRSLTLSASVCVTSDRLRSRHQRAPKEEVTTFLTRAGRSFFSDSGIGGGDGGAGVSGGGRSDVG